MNDFTYTEKERDDAYRAGHTDGFSLGQVEMMKPVNSTAKVTIIVDGVESNFNDYDEASVYMQSVAYEAEAKVGANNE